MQVNSNLFSYNKETKTFASEISTLAHRIEDHSPFEQYVNGQEGFTMVSHVSGDKAHFTVSLYERNDEGEFVAWHLVPTENTVRQFPKLNGSSVVIFND